MVNLFKTIHNFVRPRPIRVEDPELQALKDALAAKRQAIRGHLTELDWGTTNPEDGRILLTTKNLSEEWTEFVKGMMCKIVPLDPRLDLTFVLCEITEEFDMDDQFHLELELAIPVDVEMVDLRTNIRYGPFEVARWGPEEKHWPSFTTTGFLMVIFSPKLKPAGQTNHRVKFVKD